MAPGSGGTPDVFPPGESLRRAFRWLDDRILDEPRADRAKLVGEAAVRFDLTPLEEEFLVRNWARP